MAAAVEARQGGAFFFEGVSVGQSRPQPFLTESDFSDLRDLCLKIAQLAFCLFINS